MGRAIRELLENQPNLSRDRLIPILQEIQDENGYLSEEAIIVTAEFLKLPTSKIYGVATYYDQFRFEPRGKYHIRICRGTACHVEGSLNFLNELEKLLKIKSGQTTRDGLFSLDIVRCIGACGLAPVMDVNEEFYTGFNIPDLSRIIDTSRLKGITMIVQNSDLKLKLRAFLNNATSVQQKTDVDLLSLILRETVEKPVIYLGTSTCGDGCRSWKNIAGN